MGIKLICLISVYEKNNVYCLVNYFRFWQRSRLLTFLEHSKLNPFSTNGFANHDHYLFGESAVFFGGIGSNFYLFYVLESNVCVF